MWRRVLKSSCVSEIIKLKRLELLIYVFVRRIERQDFEVDVCPNS